MTRRIAGGEIVATPGFLEAVRRSGEGAAPFLARHFALDQGELDAQDQAANRQALRTGGRILSAFLTARGDRVWVITEAEDELGLRRSTCCLLPEEY
jgi:hypothetical protein